MGLHLLASPNWTTGKQKDNWRMQMMRSCPIKTSVSGANPSSTGCSRAVPPGDAAMVDGMVIQPLAVWLNGAAPYVGSFCHRPQHLSTQKGHGGVATAALRLKHNSNL